MILIELWFYQESENPFLKVVPAFYM